MSLNLLHGQIQLNYRIQQHTYLYSFFFFLNNSREQPHHLKICYWIAKMVHKHVIFLNSILHANSNLREILTFSCVWPQGLSAVIMHLDLAVMIPNPCNSWSSLLWSSAFRCEAEFCTVLNTATSCLKSRDY